MDGKTTDITPEIPFDIPDGWEWCRLGNFVTLTMGQSPAGNTVANSKNGVEFHQGKIYFGERFLSVSPLKTTEPTRIAPKGSLLICVRAPVGIVNITERKICIGRGLAAVMALSSVAIDFLATWLTARKSALVNQATGSTFVAVSLDQVKSLLLPIPPFAEQQRIVSKINHLMTEVNKIDQEAQELDKALTLAKQKVLDLAIRGKLVPQDQKDEPASELLKRIKVEKEALIKAGKIKRDKHESFIFRGDDNRYYEDDGKKRTDITPKIPFDLPDNWQWVRLHNIGEIVGGGTPSTTVKEYWENGAIAWLSPADLTGYSQMYISHGKKDITALGLQNSSAVVMPAGSLLYSSRAPIGYIVIAAGEIATNQGFKSLVPTIVEIGEFYYYVLKAVTADIKKRATGTTFKEISGAEFGATLVPLPPLAEQKRIVSQIERVFSKLETMQK